MQTGQDIKSPSSFLEPARIVAGFGIRAGDHIADFGAGHGYFTLPLARAAGPNGKVYAVDVQDMALDAIRSKAAFEHLLNIEYVRADLDHSGGSGLKDKYIDFVLTANVLFQAENKGLLLREAWRILRDEGRLAVVEWDAVPKSSGVERVAPMGLANNEAATSAAGHGSETARAFGPAPEARIKKETARAAAVQAGFEYDREFAAGGHHYGLLFVKR